MKRYSATLLIVFTISLSLLQLTTKAQYLWNSDTAFKAGSANSGRLWGYMFGDYAIKGHADSLQRGGSNQYSGIPNSRSTFQFRRIYLGYDYNITKKFAAELLLAAEDNFPAGNPPGTAPATGGDELLNNKLTFYIKLANIRVKNIWKGTDLVIGQQATPAFPLLSEKIWAYRSIERTIADIRRTPSYDMGAGLQGVFDPGKGNFGYNLLVANGTSAKPEADNFKWFYGDVYAYFGDKKFVVDLYADYERLNWVYNWHHSRQMLKGYIAYTTPALTIGVEGFVNNLKNDVFANKITAGRDTLSSTASGISLYIHGDIIKGKLRFFARYDGYTPMNKVDNNTYKSYVQNTGNYNDNSWIGNPGSAATATGDMTYKQTFMTAGLDFTPAKGVHFMPNIWYNHYATQLANQSTAAQGDADVVYRLTFYFVFGK
jgi:hypothetical protein